VRGGGITDAMDTLVRPGKPIPPGASAVHHIVGDVASAPPPTDAIHRFRGADYYVAHNCEFERSFFAAQGIELGPWICTYKCALRVWRSCATRSAGQRHPPALTAAPSPLIAPPSTWLSPPRSSRI
jgi:DNA polymerase III epsilon subunit-like protein